MISNLLRRFADPFLDRQNTKLAEKLYAVQRQLAVANANLSASRQERDTLHRVVGAYRSSVNSQAEVIEALKADVDRLNGDLGTMTGDRGRFRDLAAERRERLILSEKDNDRLSRELDAAIVQVGELTARMGEASLAAVVEHEQTVAEHRRGSDPLLVSQDKPRPGVAVHPKWEGRP